MGVLRDGKKKYEKHHQQVDNNNNSNFSYNFADEEEVLELLEFFGNLRK